MNEEDTDFLNASTAIEAQDSVGLGGLRYSAAAMGRLRAPDFLVIGAQKAGTTWLHTNIDFHPNVWLPPIKEVNYFNELYAPSTTDWERESRKQQAIVAAQYYRSLATESDRSRRAVAALEVISTPDISDDWYRAIFSHAPLDAVCGESSADYAVLPRAAISHIARLQPRLRIFVLLRDPIERLWSHLRMSQRDIATNAAPTLDFLQEEHNLWVYLGRSNYPAILRRWASVFGAESTCVLNFDEIRIAPENVLSRFCRHVGIVYDVRIFPRRAKAVGMGQESAMPPDVYSFLRRRLRPIYEEMREFMPEIAAPWWRRHYGAEIDAPSGQ